MCACVCLNARQSRSILKSFVCEYKCVSLCVCVSGVNICPTTLSWNNLLVVVVVIVVAVADSASEDNKSCLVFTSECVCVCNYVSRTNVDRQL